MQHTQQLFLEALKAALKNEQVEWNNKLEAQEWMDLFRMAEVHQILPMIYEAVYRSPAAGQADPQILAPAKAQMVRTVIMQTQKTGEFEPLYRYLRESGICPLVVKGIVCRNIYPNPDYRISGDGGKSKSRSFAKRDGRRSICPIPQDPIRRSREYSGRRGSSGTDGVSCR